LRQTVNNAHERGSPYGPGYGAVEPADPELTAPQWLLSVSDLIQLAVFRCRQAVACGSILSRRDIHRRQAGLLHPRCDSSAVLSFDHAAIAENEWRQDPFSRVPQSAPPAVVALLTDITDPLPVRRASAYLTADPIQPSRAVGHWALIEIYPLQPLTEHILAGHGADSAAENARASTSQPLSPPSR